MAQINPSLIERLEKSLGVGTKQVYSLIARKVRETHLPRHLAAITLASEKGIGITRYATPEELAEIRHSPMQNAARTEVPAAGIPTITQSWRTGKKNNPRRRSRRTGKSVFVVHGRNEELRRSLFNFLRSLGLNPLEWVKAIALTKKPSPYVGEILDAAFSKAAAVIVLLTPDDEAKLKDEFIKPSDGSHEKQLTGQSRANVLFEAGMAFGRDANKTVLVQVGEHRFFSDIGGRHVVHLDGTPAKRREFATKLQNAGCEVDISGNDWLREGNFNLDN